MMPQMSGKQTLKKLKEKAEKVNKDSIIIGEVWEDASNKISYNERRKYLLKEFNRLGMTCFEPMGAFYVFPCIKSMGMTSEEFCEKLLHSKKVAVVPGGAFGSSGEGFVRVSYSYSLDHIMEATRRIKEFLEELKNE